MLQGKSALITGAASGIGRAIVEAFIAAGADVTAADRNQSALDRLTAALPVRTILFDARDEVATDEVVTTVVAQAGKLDVLVNSHGILTQFPLHDMTLQSWNETINIDLTGVFLMMRAASRVMLPARSGRIINIASQLAIKGGVEVAHYAAAKAGVIALTKSAALEWSGAGVLVNAIAPGPIVTPLTDGMSAQWREAKEAELPLARFGVPAEVAPTAVLLASDPGGNLYTGQTLSPNSGDVMP